MLNTFNKYASPMKPSAKTSNTIQLTDAAHAEYTKCVLSTLI